MPGVWYMQITGLGDADAAGVFVADEEMLQRDLHGKGEFALQGQKGLGTPEDQTAGKGEQVQFAGEVGAADFCGEGCERAEGEKEAHVMLIGEQKAVGPGRAVGGLPIRRELRGGDAREDAESGAMQIEPFG